MKFYGNKLKQIRESKGLTQLELASKMNIIRSTVSRWESGDSIPRVNNIAEICKILNISVVEISDLQPINTKEINNYIEHLPKEKQIIFKSLLKLEDKDILMKIQSLLLESMSDNS
jgi:transcriptional regulator with XRE-family HTH domain